MTNTVKFFALLLASLVFLTLAAGCSGGPFGNDVGVTKGVVVIENADGSRETWDLSTGQDVGGNQSLEVVRPDGSSVFYKADQPSTSAALQAQAEAVRTMTEALVPPVAP